MTVDYLRNYDYMFTNDNLYGRDYLKEGLNNKHYKLLYEHLLPNKDKYKTHVDIGSGRGEFVHYINHLGFEHTTVDLKKFHNFNYPFIRCDLSKQEDLDMLKQYHWDVLTSVGVLEHIEEDKIDAVLSTLSQIADVFLITVANHEDIQHDIKLHLIMEDDKWWSNKFGQYFTINKSIIFMDGLAYYYEMVKK